MVNKKTKTGLTLRICRKCGCFYDRKIDYAKTTLFPTYGKDRTGLCHRCRGEEKRAARYSGKQMYLPNPNMRPWKMLKDMAKYDTVISRDHYVEYGYATYQEFCSLLSFLMYRDVILNIEDRKHPRYRISEDYKAYYTDIMRTNEKYIDK